MLCTQRHYLDRPPLQRFLIHMYCRLIFFEDVLHLVELVLVPPISAAQCEQAVSAQNRIKNSTRATLNVSVLADLIRLSSEGPPVSELDPTPAVDRWFERDRSKGERPRRPHFLNNSA